MPSTPRLKIINTSGVGYQTRIYIDDQDVSECFGDAKISMGLKEAVKVQLEAIVCEVRVEDAMHLRMTTDATHDLLVKHGWTPPDEPVHVPRPVKKVMPYEPLNLDHVLFGGNEEMCGRSLVDRFVERVQNDWEPTDRDELTIARVYDDNGDPVPGKRCYTLTVTMDERDATAY